MLWRNLSEVEWKTCSQVGPEACGEEWWGVGGAGCPHGSSAALRLVPWPPGLGRKDGPLLCAGHARKPQFGLCPGWLEAEVGGLGVAPSSLPPTLVDGEGWALWRWLFLNHLIECL